MLWALNHALENDPFRTLMLIQLALMPIAIKNYGLSVSKVSFPAFVCSALLGQLPTTVALTWTGSTAHDLMPLLHGEGGLDTAQVVVLCGSSVVLLASVFFLGRSISASLEGEYRSLITDEGEGEETIPLGISDAEEQEQAKHTRNYNQITQATSEWGAAARTAAREREGVAREKAVGGEEEGGEGGEEGGQEEDEEGDDEEDEEDEGGGGERGGDGGGKEGGGEQQQHPQSAKSKVT
jgi:hypothetical protein